MFFSTLIYVAVIIVGEVSTAQGNYTSGQLFDLCLKKRLKGPFMVLNEYNVSSHRECAAACVKHEKCLSVNVIPLKQGRVCQLLADYPAACDSLKTENGSHYLKRIIPRCINGGKWSFEKGTCGTCRNGFAGTYCERRMIDCAEGQENGQTDVAEREYLIQPINATHPFEVVCALKFGMTQIERRIYHDSYGNFDRSWATYKKGFGDLRGSYFIGLDKLYLLTQQRVNRVLKVQAQTNRELLSAFYLNFHIDNESKDYAMHYDVHKGTRGGDGFGMGYPNASINHSPFCTRDRDCNSCARISSSGWWFNINCARINLNIPSGGSHGAQIEWPQSINDLTTSTITNLHVYLKNKW